MNFEEVRQNLLREAAASPNLLSDLAGLEYYIAESYHKRSFIELLQNADDANATCFKIIRDNDFLYVANNGRVFSQDDLESLCRSASSKKIKGQTIGYRGIGFKSVVGFAKEIHLLSGDLEISFSKSRTHEILPLAKKVPLIRIPHHLNEDDKSHIINIASQLKVDGFPTIFVFTGITANQIETEFDSFEYNSLLFLKNVINTDITLNNKIQTKIIKSKKTETLSIIELHSNSSVSNWIISNCFNTSIAFSVSNGEIQRLSSEASIIHAFLPTEDNNGLGVIINGNFSTDPSRRHIIFDNDTINAIKDCSSHILSLLEEAFIKNTPESSCIIKALVPYSDPRVIQFTKENFIKHLITELKAENHTFFNEIMLCPVWLNAKDFTNIIEANKTFKVNKYIHDVDGFDYLAKYLGASEIKFEEIINDLNIIDLSLLGCAQITQYIVRSTMTINNLKDADITNLKIFYSGGQRQTLNEIKSNNFLLDDTFISFLYENGISEIDLKHFFKKYSINFKSTIQNKSQIGTQIISPKENPEHKIINWFNRSNLITNEPIKVNFKRWRSAEELTLEVLNLNGFKLKDVSKQNIGYDLEGLDINGNDIQIEVKSIDLPGQKFKMTNNEIAVAQVKQKSFFIAIVRQTDDAFELAMISDPVNSLTLNRQCVQWIWECEGYEYNPIRFKR